MRLFHRHFAADPGVGELDRPAGAVVAGAGGFEVVQHMGGASSRPVREQVVIAIGQRAAAPDGDEARITLLAEDHPSAFVALMAKRRCPASWTSGKGV